MTSPICLFCGYPRSAPVAGCDHSTLPAEDWGCPHKDCPQCHGAGWVNTVGSTCLACCGPVRVGQTIWLGAGEEMTNAFRAMEPLRAVTDEEGALREAERQRAELLEVRKVLGVPDGWGLLLAAQVTAREADAKDVFSRLLADEREKGNLLAAELVDLQRQVVALQAELEQERRESGRLRADLENAQQLLSEAERDGRRTQLDAAPPFPNPKHPPETP